MRNRAMAEAVAGLEAAGVACRLPPVGMMVAVLSALMAVEFDAAFFSMGPMT
ncbi:hypothetical protein [Ensifer sp. 4252]|uniref:hypothetical protein n=1 Tax=Ensifer sp. 4252 TaxID=3373915 RepID=UPI003D1BB7B1